MMKRYTPEQIVQVLREAEVSSDQEPIDEFCRRKGISTVSYYRWRAKYGGLEVSEAKRLKELEQENARLKKLLAEAMPHRDLRLANDGLKEVLVKK
jgi:putative transposase